MSTFREQGKNPSQTTMVEKVLRSMTPNFNYVVCTIEQATDVMTLTVDDLQKKLIVQEQHMINQKEEEEQALKVTNFPSSRERGRGSFRGGCGRGRQPPNKESIECYNCRKKGHYQSECLEWDEKANYAENEEEKEYLLLMARTPESSK